jgi:hypothetical protein
MDLQLSSILQFWYIPPQEPARANCDRITASTLLLFLSLWAIAATVHLLLGSVHVRNWIQRSLDFSFWETERGKIRFPTIHDIVNTLGISVLHMGFSLATAAVLSKGDSTISFKNALALWILRPTPSTLINIISLLIGSEVYSDDTAYITSGEFGLALLSIWPFAFVAGATTHIQENTRDFLSLFNIKKSAIPLLRAGSAIGIIHWILFLPIILIWVSDTPGKVRRPLVAIYNFVRLVASCLLWLGALQITGDAYLCIFYLDPRMTSSILWLWAAEPIVEALWTSLFPSKIPWMGHSPWCPRKPRDWRDPGNSAARRS